MSELLCQECKLSPPKVAPHSSDESWRVVEDLRISCALKLRRASRPQNLNSPFVGTKCLLVGHHHLLEEAPHANEVVHGSRRRRMRSRRSALPFFLILFKLLRPGGQSLPSLSWSPAVCLCRPQFHPVETAIRSGDLGVAPGDSLYQVRRPVRSSWSV